MAWEARTTPGSRYYYLSRRDPDGRVRKVYLGTGCGARRVAALVAEAEAGRAASRLRVGSARAQLGAVDTLMGELEAAADVLFEAFMASRGFHRHNYGPWRKRRGYAEHQPAAGGSDR